MTPSFKYKYLTSIIVQIQILTVIMQYFTRSPDIQLKELPILRQPTRILKISYPHNCIKKINATITKAVNLEEVDLSYNKLMYVDQIFQLRKLKYLNLSNNQISFIPKAVCKLKLILKIDLSFNLLQDIQSIQNLFELSRIRKAKATIVLEGNPVSETHKEQIFLRLKAVEEQARGQLVSDFEPGLNEETFKSSQLYSRLKSQNEEGDKSLSQLGNHLSQIKFSGSFCEAKAQLDSQLQILSGLERKFDVISGIETKNWTEILEKNFKKITGSVKSLIENYKSIILILKSDITHPSETSSTLQTCFIQTSQIQQLIKDQHKKMLESLSECHEIPMNSYRVWVQLYRDLRVLIEKIKQMGFVIIQGSIRNHQIEQLKTISPQKMIEVSQNKQDDLNGLLFSKNKSGSSEKKQQCSQCFIREQQIKQLRQLSNLLSQENLELKQQVSTLTEQNRKLTKEEGVLGTSLKQKQQNIINLLQMKSEGSVYQKLILEQAKGIEDLIKCDRHVMERQRKNMENTQKLTDFYRSASAAMQDAKFNFGKEIVSEFHLHDQEKNGNLPKWAYFNKNVDISMQKRRSKKNTEQSTSSTEKKRLKENYCQEKDLAKEKSLSNLLSMKTTERQTSEYSEFKLSREQGTSLEQKKPMSNKNVVISDFAITQGDSKNRGSNKSGREVLAELMIRKSHYAADHNIEKSKLNKISQYIVIKEENSRREVNGRVEQIEKQNKPQYVPIQYHSVKVKNEEPFQKYMKYHLKNSIIETLQKNGRRHSLNKQISKEKMIKIKSKEKEINNQNGECSGNKQSSRLLSQRFTTNRGIQHKNSSKNNYSLLKTNTKSYVDVLTKLRS